MITKRTYLTTAQLAAARGVTRQAIAAAVKRGMLEPAQILDNGYYLFDPNGDETPDGGDAA